jgi:O-antigen/teichoic acid export membrane protein
VVGITDLDEAPSGAAVKRALSWVGIGHIVGQTFWFGSLLILAVILPPAAFGAVAIGLLLVTAANRTMESGTRGSIIIAKSLTRFDIRNTVAFNVLVGVGLAAVIALLASPISHFFASGSNALVLVALGIGVALYAPAIAPLALLEKNLQYKRRAGIQMAATMTASVVAVVAALAGAGVWSLVIRQLLFQVMLAVGGWIVAVRAGVIPRRVPDASGRWRLPRRAGAAAFMLFSLTDFAVFNADSLTVGHYSGTKQLGLYALAFTLAFAPVTQFSAQIGNVLFSASAASDPETIRRRTVSGVRITSLVLLPVLPAAIVLAPVLVPALLGEKWAGMVPVFQLLLVVGVAHAIMNVIGESLSGTGNINYRARVNAVWMVAMVVALIILVQLDGIRGAGEAHLFLYLPVVAAYVIGGMRMIGASWHDLAGPLRPILVAVLVQTVATAAVWYLLEGQVSEEATAIAAALAGAVACVVYLLTGGKETVRQASSLLRRSRRQEPLTRS